MKRKRIHYSKQDIINALIEVGICKGDNIFIHSNIGFFGNLEDANSSDEYYSIYKSAIFEVIGNEGTLVNPTFTYSFCKKQDFDILNTPTTCGVFSEMARLDSESIRSEDANFSVAALGKNASYFTKDAPEYSFGANCFWERFLKKNGKFVNFNFDSASTFIHYVEKQLNVPYRYDKPFSGKIIYNESVRSKVFYHYVVDLKKENNCAYFPKFDKKAKEKGVVLEANLGRGKIISILAKDTYELIKKELKTNPSFLIKGDLVSSEIKSNINNYFDRLFPINRSLTGNGNRDTLKILSEIVDINIIEVPSGTQCFDWTVPPEWNVKQAWIKDSKGNIIVDFEDSNLHLLGYSEPFEEKLSYDELKDHIYTLPEQPELIPYLTSYYKKRWGFCMSHTQFESLNKDETYSVFIDSNLDENGSMTLGEAIIKGESDEEILLTTYICHPSLANNELSGPIVSSFIYKKLKEICNLKYTYRFVFVPETIGSIYYLSQYGKHFKKQLKAGFVLTCIGDNGEFTYKRSRIGNSLPDRATELILKQSEEKYIIHNFFPSGSDERQYCSPGFNLPVGSLMRTMYGKYPEYHTSGDNKSYISFEAMEGSINKYIDIISLIEKNDYYINTQPFCEPQLGKRGLYPTLGSQKETASFVEAMMWILNLADGTNDLIDIINKSNQPYELVFEVIDKLIESDLLKPKE